MPSSASEVLAALEVWRQAMLQKDSAALDSVLHPDVSYSHSNAHNETKADALGKLSRSTAQEIVITDPNVRVYGDTALIKTKVDFTNLVDGQIQHVPLDVLHVFLKGPSGWQMVGRQATKRPA
jgi:ketosteroid isomerase-like protein